MPQKHYDKWLLQHDGGITVLYHLHKISKTCSLLLNNENTAKFFFCICSKNLGQYYSTSFLFPLLFSSLP